MTSLGLVLISHGSPSAEWNLGMESIADRVRAFFSEKGSTVFKMVKLAHLEFATPTIADVCDEFEANGIERIIALPIFISVSSHTNLDIPNALNIGFNVDSETEIRRYVGKLPVTLCPPLDHGALLPRVIAEAASLISTDSSTECALLLSHGDGCEHFWNHLHRRVAMAVTERTGVKEVRWVTVQTGRSEASKARFKEAVAEIAKVPDCSKVLILSCFTGLSGAGFLARLAGRGAPSTSECPVLIGDKGWNSNPLLAEHISNLAETAAQICSGVSEQKKISQEEEKDLPPYNPPFYLTRDMPRH